MEDKGQIINRTRLGSTSPLSGTSQVPPWLFQHQDLIQAAENSLSVTKEEVINYVNHIHFRDGYLYVLLRHPRYEESILLRAYPKPCSGNKVTCMWDKRDTSGTDVEIYRFLYLVIDDGRSMTLVPATLLEITTDYLKVKISSEGCALGQRQTRRYKCDGITAEVIQNGFHATGKLLDFSPTGFRVRVRPASSCSFHWLNSDVPVSISLKRSEQVIFSGNCRCIRHELGSKQGEIILSPLETEIKRFRKKQIRNLRQRLTPTPTLIFEHPLLSKQVQMAVDDISTSGFSVYEAPDDAVLVPGMIIPKMEIDFQGASAISCEAQVIYRMPGDEKGVRCGISVLDMDIIAYSRLTHILTSALDPHAYISSRVDMNSLWEFFFNTGFIYPKKYRLIQAYKERFKDTYRKLYQDNPGIARHFTYQRNGKIYGHISMIRAYEKAWMIHHHAALPLDQKRTGFLVLRQIMHYLNDMYRLPSSNMNYVMCYFRPENRFPNLVFGGFSRSLKKPKGCSMDLFSYLPYTSLSLGARLPDEWVLKESSKGELWELERFYDHHSGGLLMEALGLNGEGGTLEEDYARSGFRREYKVYSLLKANELYAILLANQSDLGLNLSELLNGIKIFVINPESPWDILSTAIGKLTKQYYTEKVPVMCYPFEYVKANKIPHEKQYQAWVLNVQCGNEYLEYMQNKFKITYS
ncbi:MAG: PilZ domain-containing protein [Deltaproteobacteria bacterium]|nr:PilZ domain-containing protein [Deltaproteobacteria bacterium]MBW2065450.1 PilZ domain-containing protein [Deltaproteobacteria bacterium]